jgi:putative PIN family toxin of toxin-antitoxin system
VANDKKIILDVNIWVSAFISGKMEQQVQAIIFQDNVEIIACNELLEEFQQTFQKPKLKKYLSPERMQLAIELLNWLIMSYSDYNQVTVIPNRIAAYILSEGVAACLPTIA